MAKHVRDDIATLLASYQILFLIGFINYCFTYSTGRLHVDSFTMLLYQERTAPHFNRSFRFASYGQTSGIWEVPLGRVSPVRPLGISQASVSSIRITHSDSVLWAFSLILTLAHLEGMSDR